MMTLEETMQPILDAKKSYKNKKQEFGWWIVILADKPMYIYYFGVFNTYWEAENSKEGYFEDLKKEGSEIIGTQIKKCQPQELTISAVSYSDV